MWILPAVELRRSTDGAGDGTAADGAASTTTLSIHLHTTPTQSLLQSAQHVYSLLSTLNHKVSPAEPTTTLPPIISRGSNEDSQEVFENGVNAALDYYHEGGRMEKVVLARRADLRFTTVVRGLDIAMKLRFGGNLDGHLFYLNTGSGDGGGGGEGMKRRMRPKEFFGCTPERLFEVRSGDGVVRSEALAGTRPRGVTAEADAELLRDLMYSQKDRSENIITGRFVKNAFRSLRDEGLLSHDEDDKNGRRGMVDEDGDDVSGDRDDDGDVFFVRRLKHLQHICMKVEGKMKDRSNTVDVARSLLHKLHPTPAVGGHPSAEALSFIRKYESISFDRGYYAGPFGYLGTDSADVLVAIRSALLVTRTVTDQSTSIDDEFTTTANNNHNHPSSQLSIYAGAGVVPGSSSSAEWSETASKLNVLSSLLTQSPLTLLKSPPTVNSAFATAFVDELIRSGLTRFYICPGSRSTPLTAAIVSASKRSEWAGIVEVVSVFDERGAGFRALGYARGRSGTGGGGGGGRPAAVVTSSGTAVANLYPSVVEAGMDGVPLVLLTADRPYENRDIGANQAIDQVKMFSSTYIRWHRDISSPTDDIPISLALSDANHAVHVARASSGPVHVNIMFRENLAPDAGPVRGDDRLMRGGSDSGFDVGRLTDVAGFGRWSSGGGSWTHSYGFDGNGNNGGVEEIANLIADSKRALIVVGSIRNNNGDCGPATSAIIADFAQFVGIPIFAGVQSASLRFTSTAVIPYAEYLLRTPTIKSNLNPDLIIQLGTTLISTEIQPTITRTIRQNNPTSGGSSMMNHVLIHPHFSSSERNDPGLTVSHRISSDVGSFLTSVRRRLESLGYNEGMMGSELVPLVGLGRLLGEKMPGIIHAASREEASVTTVEDKKPKITLTEPQIVLAMSRAIHSSPNPESIFLSNSMAIRNAELFLYPPTTTTSLDGRLSSVATNRGASGIDGIISTAVGYAEATSRPTTLLIGDLATMHDLNAFHNLATIDDNDGFSSMKKGSNKPSLTTLIVNNDGGGIFSFLPIAKYGQSVGFEKYFGTPTRAFSFENGAKAFGLPYQQVRTYDELEKVYGEEVLKERKGGRGVSMLEAMVAGREENVNVHKRITEEAVRVVDQVLLKGEENGEGKKWKSARLPAKVYRKDELVVPSSVPPPSLVATGSKTLVLLHGWMGDKNEWERMAIPLLQDVPDDWTIISMDLPGHGDSPIIRGGWDNILRDNLGLGTDRGGWDDGCSIETMAQSVLRTLSEQYGLEHIEAICGYSLGGRVALKMKKLSSTSSGRLRRMSRRRSRSVIENKSLRLISDDTRLILLGANPGNLDDNPTSLSSSLSTKKAQQKRRAKDDALAKSLLLTTGTHSLSIPSKNVTYIPFLTSWYSNPNLWGDISARNPTVYRKMFERKIQALTTRAADLAHVLRYCSPARNSDQDWISASEVPSNTVFVTGGRDKVYGSIGRRWKEVSPGIRWMEVEGVGHALLAEAPLEVARIVRSVLVDKERDEVEERDYTSLNDLMDHKNVALSVDNNDDDDKIAVSSSSPRPDGTSISPRSFDYERFTIRLTNPSSTRGDGGITGIGWGSQATQSNNNLRERCGFIINFLSAGGEYVGIGEVSPLPGLHTESLEDAESQLKILGEGFRRYRNNNNDVNYRCIPPPLQCENVLALDGGLESYLNRFLIETTGGILSGETVYPSVRAGLEMAFLSLASQGVRLPLPRAIAVNLTPDGRAGERRESFGVDMSKLKTLPLNGLTVRSHKETEEKEVENVVSGRNDSDDSGDEGISYPCVKIKVGHRTPIEDAEAVWDALHRNNGDDGRMRKKMVVRADANRSWTRRAAIKFASHLSKLSVNALVESGIEFIEEPIKVQKITSTVSGFQAQVKSLDAWSSKTGLRYALDETLADLVLAHVNDFPMVINTLISTMASTSSTSGDGCAAFILKPSILGLERSLVLARIAHDKLGIGAVFSSSFDSGIGLSYTAFLATISDAIADTDTVRYSHGISTFSMLMSDTLSPKFKTYVEKDGYLRVAPLARAVYGLGLDEMRDGFLSYDDNIREVNISQAIPIKSVGDKKTRGEIQLQASILLPFSDDIAWSRLVDLPCMPRWCPWLNSVSYIDSTGETEWTLQVKGQEFRWKAKSQYLNKPHKGIAWESTSGLNNRGTVEFIKVATDTDINSSLSCLMKLKMVVVTPRILTLIFRRTGEYAKEFLEDKILKWSLESFRDIIKADLALEKGDAELGDALFNAVEGRANAIEATLSQGFEK